MAPNKRPPAAGGFLWNKVSDSLHRFCLLVPSVLLLAACATVSPARAGRTGLESLFLASRAKLLARLPEELRRTAVAGENEIAVSAAATRPVFNIIVTVKTESVYYRFTADRLTRIEIRTSSGSGALDADLAELRALHRTLDGELRARLGPPATDERTEGPPDEKTRGLATLASADTAWQAVAGRRYLPDAAVSLSFRERAVQGAGSIQLREVYEWKGASR